VKPHVDYPAVDLSKIQTVADLEALGADHLKCELQKQGLKCGGTVPERAARLFLLKSTPIDKLPPKLLAPPKK